MNVPIFLFDLKPEEIRGALMDIIQQHLRVMSDRVQEGSRQVALDEQQLARNDKFWANKGRR